MPTLTTDRSIFTYQDAIERLLDYVSANATQNTVRAIRQSILEAYDDICTARNWRYFAKHYRVATQTPESGTCSYSSSTGEFTIDSGTWPSWAELAIVEIGSTRYFIKTRTSGTVLTADDTLRPADDIDAGTTFTIYKCLHALPYDFRKMSKMQSTDGTSMASYVTLHDWLESTIYASGGGNPCLYALAAHPYEPGRFVILTQPYSDSERLIDFTYQRYPRALQYDGVQTHCRVGTITAAGTTVTGTGTTFESGMAGAIIRYGRDSASYPDGAGGLNPYKQQSYISGYSSATSISLHESLTVTAGKYTVSDPIDLDRGMMSAFWRGCEYKLCQKLKLPALDRAERDYSDALAKARNADTKSLAGRSPWDVGAGAFRNIGTDGADDF